MQLPGWLCCTWLLLLPISCKSPGSETGAKLQNTNLLFWWTFVHHTLPLFSWPGLWASNKHHPPYGNPVLGHKNLMISRFPVCNVGFDNLLPETLRNTTLLQTSPSRLATPTPFSKVQCLNKKTSIMSQQTQSIWVGMIETYWNIRSPPKNTSKSGFRTK